MRWRVPHQRGSTSTKKCLEVFSSQFGPQLRNRVRPGTVSHVKVTPTTRHGHLNADQIEALLEASSPRDRAIFHLLYAYALRVSEPLLLKRADVSKESINITRKKGSQSGRYEMLPDVWRSLSNWLRVAPPSPWLFPGCVPARPLTTRAVEYAMRAVGTKIKLPPTLAHPHALKHSAATHLALKFPLPVVAAWTGHRALRMLGTYVEDKSDEFLTGARGQISSYLRGKNGNR